MPQGRMTIKCQMMVEVNYARVQKTQTSCGLRSRGCHYEKGGFDLASEDLWTEYSGKKDGCKRDMILLISCITCLLVGQTGTLKVTSPQPWHSTTKKKIERLTPFDWLSEGSLPLIPEVLWLHHTLSYPPRCQGPSLQSYSSKPPIMGPLRLNTPHSPVFKTT